MICAPSNHSKGQSLLRSLRHHGAWNNVHFYVAWSFVGRCFALLAMFASDSMALPVTATRLVPILERDALSDALMSSTRSSGFQSYVLSLSQDHGPQVFPRHALAASACS